LLPGARVGAVTVGSSSRVGRRSSQRNGGGARAAVVLLHRTTPLAPNDSHSPYRATVRSARRGRGWPTEPSKRQPQMSDGPDGGSATLRPTPTDCHPRHSTQLQPRAVRHRTSCTSGMGCTSLRTASVWRPHLRRRIALCIALARSQRTAACSIDATRSTHRNPFELHASIAHSTALAVVALLLSSPLRPSPPPLARLHPPRSPLSVQQRAATARPPFHPSSP
jgi:hypothetical protein